MSSAVCETSIIMSGDFRTEYEVEMCNIQLDLHYKLVSDWTLID